LASLGHPWLSCIIYIYLLLFDTFSYY
jgi:hypothetical protein